MKKILFIGLALIATIAMTGCKSKESNYKKAYEKAKAQEMAQQTSQEAVSVTPVVTQMFAQNVSMCSTVVT